MHGLDAHALVDLATVLVAVASAYLAARRNLLDRIAALEQRAARIEGALEAQGVL